MLAGLWLLLGAIWLAVYPLLAGGGRVPPSAEGVAELEAEKDRLIRDLHELDLDRATGKLSEEDYRALEARLKRRAVATLEEIDAARPRSGAERTAT
ncbi:MAG TPA: hypothetical protein VFP76_03995 [Gemmatimonadota bacterium]|nr:hypothetical protein [Gemmatimonadota bacterium]